MENNITADQQNTPVQPEPGFFKKYSTIIKGIIIFVLLLIFIIPQVIIHGLIYERESNQEMAFRDISEKWSGRQTITGPVLSIPYYEYYRDTAKVLRYIKKNIYFLPDVLNINGRINTEKRHRNIYEVVVYNSKIKIDGNFDKINLAELNIPARNVIWNEAVVMLGLNDLRGINEKLEIKFDEAKYSFNPGNVSGDIYGAGVLARVKIDSTNTFLNSKHNFNIELDLKGSEQLFFTPVGKTTKVTVQSSWATPAFNGQFLPEGSNITESGFTANWKVLHLNRNYPQQFIDNAYNLNQSQFGVDLIMPIDGYQKTSRSVKYAMMVILLTFLVFFFVEISQQKKIHPFNYIIVGFALCLFYTLLLSFSEYMTFNLAYLIATTMTVGAIFFYTYYLFKGTKVAQAISGLLLLLYGFMFVIIQLESYALLIGSLGLFVVLIAVMNYSKNIDWYNLGKKVN